MKLVTEIAKVLGQFDLHDAEMNNISLLTSKVKLKPIAVGSSIPGVFHNETNTLIAQADDFFVSVLMAGQFGKDSAAYNQLIQLTSKIVTRVADSDDRPEDKWISGVHPMIKLTEIYAAANNRNPFFYDSSSSGSLVSLAEQYSSYAHSDVVARFFEGSLEKKCIELGIAVLGYDVTKSVSDNAVRAFFSNLLQDMPSHYFVARREQIVEIARRLASSVDLSRVLLDARDPSLSITEYVNRKSGSNHDAAQACVYLFNEKSFTELFDAIPENHASVEPESVLLY